MASVSDRAFGLCSDQGWPELIIEVDWEAVDKVVGSSGMCARSYYHTIISLRLHDHDIIICQWLGLKQSYTTGSI